MPDASVAINIAASFTYYYLAPDAGTYFWHCHITPPEHLQMGMVGQLYVRPRQNRVPVSNDLYAALQQQELDLRTKCDSTTDILCSNPLPALPAGATTTVGRAAAGNYAYNDGDGSTYYDVEYPIQMHGFDPNFHFVGMTFNPEGFADMKDKYFLLNGRSYPDTVNPDPLQTQSADGVYHFSQPLATIIKITPGQRALLRISNLNVSEYHTLASLGVKMQVIALNVQWLVGGIVVTECVFGYPGIGQALVQAVSARDVPYVLSVGMLIAIVYIALNVLADLLVVLLVPKLRTAQ